MKSSQYPSTYYAVPYPRAPNAPQNIETHEQGRPPKPASKQQVCFETGKLAYLLSRRLGEVPTVPAKLGLERRLLAAQLD